LLCAQIGQGLRLTTMAGSVPSKALRCHAHPPIARRLQTTVMMPASPMRCQGRPSTSASSWADSSCHCALRRCRPDELALVQAASGQPDADAVVHQHLHAVGAFVGEQVGVMGVGSAEDG
jgi:hypothetical protein